MIQLFNNKSTKNSIDIVEEDLRNEIVKRARVNTSVRTDAKSEILKQIDQILDKVSGFENSKITAITELYLALESGNSKNLIDFLKKPDVVIKVKKEKKKY